MGAFNIGVFDAGGTFQRTKVRIPELHIGKDTLDAQNVFLVDDRKDGGDDFDGVLEVRGLRVWKVAFDFANRRFSGELSADAQQASARGHSDFRLPPSTQTLRESQ
jgi:hypothetical protein